MLGFAQPERPSEPALPASGGRGGGGAGSMADPTPRPVRRALRVDCLSGPNQPSLRPQYCGSPATSPCKADSSTGGGGSLLQSTLTAIRQKEALGAAAITTSSTASGSIGAHHPHSASAPLPLNETLATDYRAQLQQYAQRLAAKNAETTALRQQASELRQQLAAAETRAGHASQQLTRNTTASGQLEAATAALEAQLEDRERELQAALQAKRTAEQAAAAAKAQAAAVQKSVSAKMAEYEQDRRFFKEQLEAKDQELHSLETALRKQAAELERQSQDWVQREAEHSSCHSRTSGAAAAVQAELAVAQEKLEAANKRMRTLESENGELRRQKAQVAADMRMLEELLSDSDAERRELHDKYVCLGEKLEVLIKEGKILRSSASSETDAARSAAQEALKNAEAALKERGTLKQQVQQLQLKLEEEQGRRTQLKDNAQRKLAAAEQEVAALRVELEGKARQLQILRGDMKALQAEAEGKLGACEKQMMACKDRMASLDQELDAERQRSSKAVADADAHHQERLRLELQQQALKYERRIQELEMYSMQGSSGAALSAPGNPAMRASVLDYIPRAEHVRLLEARLAAKESDMQLEGNTRVAQAEREAQWKLESKEQEISSLTAHARQLEDDLHTERQRASSGSNKLADEAKRLAAQCIELQRDLNARDKELMRLKERLKDALSTNADMDDDAMSSSRQVARLRHALEDSQQTLRGAQAALSQERQRSEEAQRELAGQASSAADAERRSERLAGEVRELEAALEQKQELITALQAESDGWSAKLMAHREHHQREVDVLRKQLKDEWKTQVEVLEQRCLAAEAELRETRRQQEDALCQLGQQHVAQVGQLESQLAAAERCNAELKELTAALGSVRQEDVETLKGVVQELQLRLKEATRERDGMQRQHQEQTDALAAQIKAKMGAFRRQQAHLRQEVEGDVAASFAECLASYEAGLAALKKQLEQQTAAATCQQSELADRAARLSSGLQAVLEALRSKLPDALPGKAMALLLEGGSASCPASASELQAAAQQLAHAVQQQLEQVEAEAIHSALAAMEAELLPVGTADSSSFSSLVPRPASPSRLLSPRKRQQMQQEAAAAAAAAVQRAPSLETNERRLAALLGRCQELLAQVSAGDSQVAQLRQQVVALEGSLAEHQEKLKQAKGESLQAAEAARVAAVAPLQAEVARLQERVEALQQLHVSELTSIEAAARQHHSVSQAESQAALDRLAAKRSSLQQQLRSESDRAEGLAIELAGLQEELAKHTQRAASKIEMQDRELEMLKGRLREMESRDAAQQQDLRALRLRELEISAT